MKRLESLRGKFEKDDRFFKKFKKFIEELMEMRHVRKCSGKGTDGKTWYVPHQGVLNPNKGKIRVVFLLWFSILRNPNKRKLVIWV